MFRLIEKWDNIAWLIYNFFSVLKYILIDQFRYKKILKKNKELKDKHKGERCFIVLNGPSIKALDLSKLKNETTICSNYFYLSDCYDDVAPNYYCICDSATFNDDRIHQVHELMKKGENVKYIFNKKALGKLSADEKEKTYFVYGMHMPNLFRVRDNLAGVSSSFINVGMFCMTTAMYMGFKDIYVLGNDFAPGAGLMHCYGKTETEEKVNKVYQENNRVNLCTFYWCYFLAHLQNFYVAKHARKKGVKIYNVNKDSYVRSFEFADYDELFS